MHVAYGKEKRNPASLNIGAGLTPYLAYADYAGAIRRWESYTSPGQFTTILYDDVVEAPEQVLRRIHALAGLPELEPIEGADEWVFQGVDSPIPRPLLERLLHMLRPQYEFLKSRYPVQVERWLKKHDRAMVA